MLDIYEETFVNHQSLLSPHLSPLHPLQLLRVPEALKGKKSLYMAGLKAEVDLCIF
jgi:hypothetical protein